MAGKKRKDVREEDVTGLKYFDKLAPLLARLHAVGCQRDKAGNRTLHFDQYCMLVLLFLFNPVVRSMRAIEQASALRKVQRKLGCQRASLASLSEATDVFQPERLKEIIAELGAQLQPIARDPRLKDVQHTLTLVDGTLLKGLPVLVQAALGDPRAAKHKAKFRLHTQFDLQRGVPIRIDVTAGISRGEADERAVLAKALQTGRCYVQDRGYTKFQLFNEIVAAQSSYVCRLRDNSRYEIVERRALGNDDTAAGVLLDLDLPAWIIALIYRYRWTIEIFFRFFKHVLGCRHLLSHNPLGVQIQTYCAIIACMLISLWTGRKPTLRTYEMICHYFTGLAEEDELLAHLAKLQAHDA